MGSLQLSFESIAPIFLMMLLGYVLKSIKLADKKSFDTMNRLVFKVFLPILLFYNIYKTEAAQVFDGKLIAFAVAGVLCVFLLGSFAVLALTKDNAKRGVMLQGFFRSNYSILGVPLVSYICGDGAGGLTSLMVAVVVPMFNVLAVISLERFREGNIDIKKLIKGIVTNPLIIGCLAGILCFGLRITLPVFVEKAVSDISKIATPLAIIILGASFTFSSMKGYVREILIVVSVRLLLVPFIMLTAAVLLGFSGEALACLMVVFGSPVAVSSFAMAQQMGGDEKLAAQLVVVSSAACLVTLFFWIFVLSSLGLFG